MKRRKRFVRYIGTTDSWQNIEFVVERAADLAQGEVGHFVSVVGGLSALHLLPVTRPRAIALYDTNPAALEYARLFRALVLLAETRLDLMRMIFGRAFTDLDELTVERQREALACRPAQDPEVIEPLIEALDGQLWASYLRCLLDDQADMAVFPSWSERRNLRIGGERRRLWGVESQTLHLGRGWLSDEGTYAQVRRCLAEAPISYHALHIGELPALLETLHAPGRAAPDVVYISNIDEFMKAAYPPLLERIITAERRNPLVWISRNHAFPLPAGLKLDAEPVERRFASSRFIGISVASPTYLLQRRKSLRRVAPPERAPEPPKHGGEGIRTFQRVPIERFADGSISLHWQTDPLGNVNLEAYRIERAAEFDNPARDPVTLFSYDGKLELANGYHRTAELLVRGYTGEVAAWVIEKKSRAEYWDRRHEKGAFGYLDGDDGAPLFAEVARIVREGGARSVMDVGCWHGNLLRALDDVERYVGVDLSQRALDAAATIETSIAVELYAGDLARLPVPETQVDAIYFGACLGYVDDPVSTICAYADRYRPKLIIWQEASGFVDVVAHLPRLWMAGRFQLRAYIDRKFELRKFARRRIAVMEVLDQPR